MRLLGLNQLRDGAIHDHDFDDGAPEIGIGGDPVPGSSFIDIIKKFEADPETELIVMSGEIGGSAEEEAAAYIADHVSKPVVAYIAGFTAPPGKTMGHAGAIVSGSQGTAAAKAEALESKGVRVGRTPTQVAEIAVRERIPAAANDLHVAGPERTDDDRVHEPHRHPADLRQDDEMIHAAHASRFHWSRADGAEAVSETSIFRSNPSSPSHAPAMGPAQCFV